MRIGIDVGGTNLVVGLCSEQGALLAKTSVPTKIGDADGMLQDCLALCEQVCREQGVAPSEVSQIGIGVPGSIEKETSTLTFGTNLGMQAVCFQKAFAPTFDCPVYLDNDANCAALGEAIAGAGNGKPHVIMVTLGTGVGGGIIIDGKLYRGANDSGAEIGHMVIVQDGEPCACGRHGCLESYASATALIRMAREQVDKTQTGLLYDWTAQEGKKLDAKLVCDACDAGDALAQEVFATYLAHLACGVTSLITIFQPDVLVIGGGVAGYGDKLLKPLTNLVDPMRFPCAGKQTDICLATLGNDAGIVGAAMLDR